MLINKKNGLKSNVCELNLKTIINIKFKTKMIKYNISSIPENENNNIKDNEFGKELLNKEEKEREKIEEV